MRDFILSMSVQSAVYNVCLSNQGNEEKRIIDRTCRLLLFTGVTLFRIDNDSKSTSKKKIA